VLATMAQTLGLKVPGNEPVAECLSAFLQNKHLLLVLDNFEQVLAAASPLVELLTASPQLKLLVTSREVLHLHMEQQFAVPPLALPDLTHLPDSDTLAQYPAVKLFIQRAQAVKHDFQVAPANAAIIAEVCTRLDGLPLALELAAARIKLLSPPALLARLDRRLQVLTGGARDLPERQRTLRATIEWSYNLLNAQEQRLFRWLSIFVGGCTLAAAEALCQADQEDGEQASSVFEGVASLLDKSLVQQTEREGEEPRLVMLETLREFGLACLQGSGELEAARRAHARYYLELAEQAEPELRGPNQAGWLQCLEQEHDNLRAALEWALEEVAEEQARERREMALRLSTALKYFWLMHGHYREAYTFLERALARSEGASASLRAKVLRVITSFVSTQGDHGRAELLAQQSLALYRELGDIRGIAKSLASLAVVAWKRGKLTEALSLDEEIVRLIRQVGEPREVAEALCALASQVSALGEYTKGQALFEEALLLFRQAGNELWVGITLVQSAFWLWLTLGDLTTMRQRLQQGQALITKVGHRHWSAHSSWVAALIALSEQETARADDLAQESLAVFREIGDRWWLAWTLHVLGRVERQRGDLKAARSRYRESLALTQQLGEKWITPFPLEGLAGVVATQGDLRWAAQLWGAAEALREAMAFPLLPADRAGYEQAVHSARAQLGASAFAAAWAEGRAMTPGQALAAQEPAVPRSAPTVKTSPTYPAGLTAREVEILRLVAQGLTYGQVAETLVISPRTVNWHLTTIYSKLQVSSRSAATRYAIEHHLI
jgi:predicted ATPase/DNA-binding CsgD family transcriptional regulator